MWGENTVPSVPSVQFLVPLLPSEHHVLGIRHYQYVALLFPWGVGGLVFPLQPRPTTMIQMTSHV
jgi:hypothetical protein